jgi:hypothetical protein
LAAGTDIVLARQSERLDYSGSLGELVDALAIDNNFFTGISWTDVVNAGFVENVVGLGRDTHVSDIPVRRHLSIGLCNASFAGHFTFRYRISLRQVDAAVNN